MHRRGVANDMRGDILLRQIGTLRDRLLDRTPKQAIKGICRQRGKMQEGNSGTGKLGELRGTPGNWGGTGDRSPVPLNLSAAEPPKHFHPKMSITSHLPNEMNNLQEKRLEPHGIAGTYSKKKAPEESVIALPGAFCF
jgi:hypothetical protein